MDKTTGRNPHPLFDALLAEMQKGHGTAVRINDAALCRALHILPPTLSKMRMRKLPVSDATRVAIMRTFNWPLKKLDELAPPEAEQGAAQ